MKLIYILLFSLIFISVNGQSTFDTTYSQPSFNYGISVAVITNGSYLLVGSSRISGTSYDISVSKADDEGNIIWQNYYGISTANELAYNIRKLNDNSYFVVGTISTGNPFVMNIDSNGIQLSFDTLNSVSAAGLDILETFDHKFAVLTSNGITKIDTAGAVIWTKNYVTYIQPYSFIQTPDSGFAIIGDNYQTALGQADIVLIKTNSSGDSLWTKLYGGPNPDDKGITINICSDGGYIIGGAYDSGIIGTVYPFAYLVRTNSAGDTLWTKIVSDPFSLGEDHVIHIFQAGNGSFVYSISHVFQDFFGTYFFYMSINKSDSSGNIMWSNQFENAVVDHESRDLQPTPDNGFILYCSRLYPPFFFPDADMRLIKTDSIGNLITDIPAYTLNQKTLKINPNPTSGILTINFDLNPSEKSMQIFDTLGNIIFFKNHFYYSKLQMDLSDKPKGIYFAKIFQGNQIFTSKIIIQ